MDQGPDQLRTEIEQTRRRLGDDVDALTEKVHPGRAVTRRATAARSRMTGMKERVMGTTSDAAHRAGDSAGGAVSTVTDSARSAAQGAGDAVTSAPVMARERTEGNPLAAGVIAFGVGWLASSLLPASQKEQQAAQRMTETAKANIGPVKEAASTVAGDMKEALREPAQDAVESVKSTAGEAASTVQQEAQSAAGEVKQDAQSAAQDVREQSSGGDDGSTGSSEPDPYRPLPPTTSSSGTGAW